MTANKLPSSRVHSRLKILIVDDDAQSAGMLVEILAGEGFESAYALSGAAALARLSRRSFDLVILDLVTGKTDGLELLRCLRMQGSIPVLMLIARGDEE